MELCPEVLCWRVVLWSFHFIVNNLWSSLVHEEFYHFLCSYRTAYDASIPVFLFLFLSCYDGLKFIRRVRTTDIYELPDKCWASSHHKTSPFFLIIKPNYHGKVWSCWSQVYFLFILLELIYFSFMLYIFFVFHIKPRFCILLQCIFEKTQWEYATYHNNSNWNCIWFLHWHFLSYC